MNLQASQKSFQVVLTFGRSQDRMVVSSADILRSI